MRSIKNPTLIYHAGHWSRSDTDIIGEQSVSLTVNNDVWLTFMCTPTDLEALAIGFLYNEGIIESLDEIANVRICPGEDNVDVWINHQVNKPKKWIRTSGCSGGRTSKDNSEEQEARFHPKNGALFSADKICHLSAQLLSSQELYCKTGGVHTSALSDGEKILVVAEDIGRHNTLDKLAGHYLMEHLSPKWLIILTTGRISSEMMQKAGRIGASVVVSRTSPTSLSVRIAEREGITLIGYAHRDRFIVYTHAERIITSIFEAQAYSEAK